MEEPEDYLARAKEADEAALRAQTLIAKNCWRTIAETYRLMAQSIEQDRQEHSRKAS